MDTSYELWNVESGNIIGAFTTTDEALAVVQHLIDSFGQSYALELSLGRRDGDGDGDVTIVGEGSQLVAMLNRSRADAKQGRGAVRQAG